MRYCSIYQRKYLIIFIVFFSFSMPSGNLKADIQSVLDDCSQIENDEERLKCYDEIARRSLINEKPVANQSEEAKENYSYLSRLWELDEEKPRGKYSIISHRSNYILPVAHNKSPNKTIEDISAFKNVQESEVKFQISLKTKLWQDVLGKDMDLWFGYTQQSFWQLYNFDNSAPFRETNYEPELLLNFRIDYNLLGMKGRIINLGFNHQSNGRTEPLSRSWNRIVGNFGFEKNNFTLFLKTWYRIPESREDDDNHDLEDYMGPGEIWGYYFWKNQRVRLMLRNNFHFHENRGALQLDWSIPVIEKIGFQIQYFNGYGESLLDYNHHVNRIGIGFILTDWI